METSNKEQILLQTLDLLDTAQQASLELLQIYSSGNHQLANTIIDDLRAVMSAVRNTKGLFSKELTNAYINEFIENIEYELDEIECSVKEKNIENAIASIEYMLFPYLRQLWEALYFWGIIYPDPKKIESYYNKEFVSHYQNPYLEEGKPARYRVSVVVVAYNHLDITKRCVESVLKHTNFEELNAELVLVDHGSTDGTLDYFKSLGIGRIIHFKANMRGVSFCMLPRLCDCEYYVHVANDTVVTKDWLNILLTCVESDPKIALASPASCNISNMQSLNVPVVEYEDVITYAEKHNKCNPSQWREHVRVLPVIGVFNSRILNQIGFWDPFFYTFDFMDDDFSIRARRGGYKQILCDDVVCYHQGSATIKEEQKKENLLEVGRNLFILKHGVDPWGTGHCFDIDMLNMITMPMEKTINILGIDCGYGDTLLQICNLLKNKGYTIEKHYITMEAEYLLDLKAQTDNIKICDEDNLSEEVLSAFERKSFSIVCMGTDVAKYHNLQELLCNISKRICRDGQILFFVENPYFVMNIDKILKFCLCKDQVTLVNPDKVLKEAKGIYNGVNTRFRVEHISGIEGFIAQHYGVNIPDNIKRRLEISKYYIRCTDSKVVE